MVKVIKISCEKAAEICNKAQYNNASLLEKIKLRYHLVFCKVCATYSKQNNLLTRMLTAKTKSCDHTNFCLDESMKNELKNKLKELS